MGTQIPCKYSGYIDDYPAELGKKITLVKYFRANFLERMTARDITKEEVGEICPFQFRITPYIAIAVAVALIVIVIRFTKKA